MSACKFIYKYWNSVTCLAVPYREEGFWMMHESISFLHGKLPAYATCTVWNK